MARRQRFFHTDYFNLIPSSFGFSGQAFGDFGLSIANFWGNSISGVTVGPFWMNWWVLSLDAGIEAGGVAVGVIMATDQAEAADLPAVDSHGGRYAIHSAVHTRLTAVSAVLPQPWNQLGMMQVESKSQVKVPRVDQTLFVVAGLEVEMDVSVRVALTAMVVLP